MTSPPTSGPAGDGPEDGLSARIAAVSQRLASDPADVWLRLRMQRLLVYSGAPDRFEEELDRCLDTAHRNRDVDGSTVSGLLLNIHMSAAPERVGPRLHRLLAVAARSRRAAPVAAAVARSRALLALRDREAFVAAAAELPRTVGGAERMVRHLTDVARTWSSPRHPDLTRAPVFVIGLSRTGTLSTHRALERLGFSGPHWLNRLTGDLIADDDLVLFDAFADINISGRFEQLAVMFPAARFVWTVRPLDSWLRSVTRHYGRNIGVHAPPQLLEPRFAGAFRGERGRVEAAVYSHHPTFEAAHAAHERRVERFFADGAGHRLLRFPVTEGAGWQPLCDFLGVPVPPVPFPHLHRTEPSSGSDTDVT